MRTRCVRWVRWRPRLARAFWWMRCISRRCSGNRGVRRFIWERISLYQQSDQSLWAERHSLRMDSGAAGSGAAHVAGGRFHVRSPGASSRDTWRSLPSTISIASAIARVRCWKRIVRWLTNSWRTSGARLRTQPLRHHRVSAAQRRHTAEFVRMLREKFETSVVPGEFFEEPQHFRLGFCGATETVRGGLERLSAALETFQSIPHPDTCSGSGILDRPTAQ
jgi:hypothetical protein